MKMLVSHAFEENTIFNYSEDLHFLPGFGSLNSFSTVEKEHVNIFLIMCPNVLNGHDKWFWVRFTIFKSIGGIGNTCLLKIYFYFSMNILRHA